jgi:signal transduction histidine kinase
MKPSMRVRRSILLTVAFAGLLLIIGGSALAVWRNSTTAQARVAALHNAHLEAGNALASIRANVYLTGILTRDYLLDPDPGHASQYAGQFLNIRRGTEDSFRVLEASAQNAEEKVALERLRREEETYLDPTRIILDWTPQEKNVRRAAFLQERVHRREEIVALATRVERMMTENFSTERERITKSDEDFRSSLAWTTGIALLLGLGIAGVTLARMIALERHSQVAESELRRLSAQLRTAQEQERTYLSRELHDEVGQMLTGLRMELSAMGRMSADADSELSSRITHAKGIVENTLGIVRNIAMLLRPSMLDDLGLTPAVAWLVKETSRSSGMEFETNVDPALNLLPDTHRTCLYRVAQEALTNISKHAGAHKVEVSLKIVGGWVVGTIADDGCGFDTRAITREGLGLAGMEERLRELGGHLRVISVPGEGTRLEFRLPVPKAAEGIVAEKTVAESQHDSHSDRGRSRHRPDRLETSP